MAILNRNHLLALVAAAALSGCSTVPSDDTATDTGAVDESAEITGSGDVGGTSDTSATTMA